MRPKAFIVEVKVEECISDASLPLSANDFFIFVTRVILELDVTVCSGTAIYI